MAPARISAASFRPVMNGCIDVEAQLGSTGRWNQRGQGRSESRQARRHSLMSECRLLARWLLLYTAIRGSGGSLDFIEIFQYKKQPNHFHTVLLYNRGTEPQIILFYHPGEVQVPQVPRI